MISRVPDASHEVAELLRVTRGLIVVLVLLTSLSADGQSSTEKDEHVVTRQRVPNSSQHSNSRPPPQIFASFLRLFSQGIGNLVEIEPYSYSKNTKTYRF